MTVEDIKPIVREYLGAHMLPTIACESGFKQFDKDGKVLRSPTNDVGIFQINVDHWGDIAKELGYDIYTPIGNAKMARHIYSVQGPRAWVCYQLLYGKT